MRIYTVYVLKSKITKRYYIGHASDLENRLKRHNAGLVRSTKGFIPWVTIYQEKYNTKSAAYRRELRIKAYKGGEAFKKLINQ